MWFLVWFCNRPLHAVYDDDLTYWYPGHALPDFVSTSAVLAVYEPLCHNFSVWRVAGPYIDVRSASALLATSCWHHGLLKVALGTPAAIGSKGPPAAAASKVLPAGRESVHPEASPMPAAASAPAAPVGTEADEDEPDSDDPWPGERALEGGEYLPMQGDSAAAFLDHVDGLLAVFSRNADLHQCLPA